MSSQYPNGTSKTTPVQRSSVDWYPEKQLDVIGIDFGTSTLALAYKVNGKVHALNIQEESTNAYVPTVLLVMENGHVEVGDRALEQYCRMENITGDYIFFERVKLHLQHDKTVCLETEVKASDEKHYYVVEVIALILREVRRKLSDYFEGRGGKCSLDDFHWVLTVPALWGEKARDMMREAAFMAGLCSNNPKWNKVLTVPLRPSYTHKITSIKEFESHPERLSLVYEPDAAAMWCKQMSDDDVKTIKDDTITAGDVTTDNFFLTIDVGGGTIDVTAHQVLEYGRMKRINIPHGEVFGGTIVNQAFKKFLEKEVVHDNEFARFLSGQDKAENKAELHGLVYESFEKTKKRFAEKVSTSENGEAFMVQLPFSFASTYRTSLEQFIDNYHTDIAYKTRTQKLQISRSKMSSFFALNIAKLHECIRRARDAVVAEYGDKFEIFYLVGGFGGCNLIAEEIRRTYGCCLERQVKVFVPQHHDLAVVNGACVYYDHQILSNSDATYGIGIAQTYDPDNEIHVQQGSVTNDEGEKNCTGLFQPIVHNRQALADDEVYLLNKLVPFNNSSRTISIQVYCSKADYVNYTTGEDKKKLKEVAKLKVDVSDGLHLPRHQREIEVLLDFTGVEIKIFARFKHNGVRVNACIDFLSTLNKFDNI